MLTSGATRGIPSSSGDGKEPPGEGKERVVDGHK